MNKEFLLAIDRLIERFLRWGSLICLVSLLILVAGNVLFRFIPILSMGWADEIIEFFFAWMIFLCAANLWRERSHFRVELVPNRLTGTKRGRNLEMTLCLLALFFFFVFSYEGGILSAKATDRSPIMEWPRYLWYFVLPFSGGIMIIYTMRDLWHFIKERFY
ncbi:MAG: TRAP transporter small permease [Thermodesulfobacteriota bacterium]